MRYKDFMEWKDVFGFDSKPRGQKKELKVKLPTHKFDVECMCQHLSEQKLGEKTPFLKFSMREGVVKRTSPLKTISIPPWRLTYVENPFPRDSTTSGGKSSITLPRISYSRKIYLFISTKFSF